MFTSAIIKNNKAALFVVASLIFGTTASAQEVNPKSFAETNFTSFGRYWIQLGGGIQDNNGNNGYSIRVDGNVPIYKGDVYGLDIRGSIGYSDVDGSDYSSGGTYIPRKLGPYNTEEERDTAKLRNTESYGSSGSGGSSTFFLSLYVVPSWKVLTEENLSITTFISTGIDLNTVSVDGNTNYWVNRGRDTAIANTITKRVEYSYTGDKLEQTSTGGGDTTTVAFDTRVGAEFVLYKFFQITPFVGYAVGNNSYSTAVLGVDLGVRVAENWAVVGNVSYFEKAKDTSALIGVRYTF